MKNDTFYSHDNYYYNYSILATPFHNYAHSYRYLLLMSVECNVVLLSVQTATLLNKIVVNEETAQEDYQWGKYI